MRESTSDPQYIVFNLNRKGTVMYFGQIPNGQLWTPSPHHAALLSQKSAERLAKRYNAVMILASLIDPCPQRLLKAKLSKLFHWTQHQRKGSLRPKNAKPPAFIDPWLRHVLSQEVSTQQTGPVSDRPYPTGQETDQTTRSSTSVTTPHSDSETAVQSSESGRARAAALKTGRITWISAWNKAGR